MAAERGELQNQDSDSSIHITPMKRARGQHLKQPAWPGRQLSQELRLQKDMWKDRRRAPGIGWGHEGIRGLEERHQVT